MPKLLIKLNNSPEDEIAEIRELLAGNDIDFYETDAGRWGFSLAGIWLPNEEQWDTAQGLLQAYQQQRSQRVQLEYAELRQQGRHDTFIRRLSRQPLAMIIYLLTILAILYLTLLPFLGLFH